MDIKAVRNLFQFYLSSIKSKFYTGSKVAFYWFQFYLSSIKSL